MSLLIQYLVKLSISLSMVWLFYQFVLRRLTFYNTNRWYLLGYTLLSFFIPFINISLLFDGESSNELVQIIPSVHQYTIALEEASHCPIPIWSTPYDKWDFLGFSLMIGAAIFLLRFAKSFISFLRIRNKAELISAGEINIYQVNNEIIPFSFGNSVFINHSQHTTEELEEIVRHEFVHVKQKHTIDIIWAELLCILNWYNPFAWLLKRSIRQNLEFIADNKVIENGINKKEYQYLLLKVIGNNQFSIATQFNFSSLKKRIVMMNKTKSAKRQVGRFLFLVPVFAIILLAFRKSFNDSTKVKPNMSTTVQTDTIPDVKILNSKGYYIDIKDNNGDCMVVIKDKDKKEVKRLLLTEWKAKDDYYENLYGEILSPKIEAFIERNKSIKEAIIAKNPDITNFEVKGNIATVTLKNGKTEAYTLSIKDQKKAFEERCGLEEIAIATTLAEEVRIAESPVEVTVAKEANVVSETIADDFEITDKKAVMHMRNGKTEEYDLTNEKEREAFEKKFGKIIKAGTTAPGVYSIVSAAEPTELPLSTTVSVNPAKEIAIIPTEDEFVVGEAEILLTITKKTTKEELESFRNKLKAKGFDLNYDKIEYENGNLKKISGSVKSKDMTGKFSGTDFSKVVVSIVRQGENEYFRVNVAENKKVVS